ncbi:uncharacterized protein K452DRAFT_227913 [Aplosporella prunicola CBS 121167]|uniref:Uncharacterized protein n=1 Tax=Aplosporella prunicola CBS 121167 TaxID=1176127 RepID=A0A6A6BBQ3_9PEZI|nr:uncharacterized protein K452DRAFT_227913 [Aplosporella prunicola CBS 121167]KAF2141629.1 hypothetical protein K452DRAFT_227913 [Aplosporella prunicola CBS 121167]
MAAPAAAANTKRMDTWGGSLSLGPAKANIKHSVTTIIPGPAPNPQTGELFLWPGMSNGTGDLVQTTIESWSDGNWCGGTDDEWCVRASLFGGFGQKDGPAASVSKDMKVKIEYTLESDGETWTQMVTDADTGKQLSTFSYASGPYMTGWGTGTECDDGCSGTIAEQKYINTKITLDAPDKTFIDTLSTAGGATYEGLKMSDDGTVLTIDTITIPAME